MNPGKTLLLPGFEYQTYHGLGSHMIANKDRKGPVRKPTWSHNVDGHSVSFNDLLRRELTANEHMLLGIIRDGQNAGEGCFASNPYLANTLRTRIRSVQRLLVRLQDKGHIKIKVVDGKRHIYTLTDQPVYKTTDDRAGTQKRSEDSSEVFQTSSRLHDKRTPRSGGSRIRSCSLKTKPTKPAKDDDGMLLQDVAATPPSRTTPNSTDLARSQRLRDIVASRGWPLFAVNSPGKWEDAFRILRQQLEKAGKEGLIDQVLDWYEKSPHIRFRVVTGYQFKRQFADLWSIMENDKAKNPAQEPVSPEAEKAAKNLWDQAPWPKITREVLARSIQQSITNLKSFIDGCRRVCRGRTERDELYRFIHRYVLPELYLYSRPESIIERHFQQAHAKVANWPEWSGSTKWLVWSLDQKDVAAKFRTWVNQWSFGSDVLTKLVQAISEPDAEGTT